MCNDDMRLDDTSGPGDASSFSPAVCCRIPLVRAPFVSFVVPLLLASLAAPRNDSGVDDAPGAPEPSPTQGTSRTLYEHASPAPMR